MERVAVTHAEPIGLLGYWTIPGKAYDADLDAPVPELGDLGDRSFKTQAERIKKLARDNGFTLRQTVRRFEAGAFDGINITVTAPSEFARFTDQVLPILRDRGVVRSE